MLCQREGGQSCPESWEGGTWCSVRRSRDYASLTKGCVILASQWLVGSEEEARCWVETNMSMGSQKQFMRAEVWVWAVDLASCARQVVTKGLVRYIFGRQKKGEIFIYLWI